MDEKTNNHFIEKNSYQIVSGKQGVPNHPPYNMLTVKKETNALKSQTTFAENVFYWPFERHHK